MRVVLLMSRAVPDARAGVPPVVQEAGEVIDVSRAEARVLLESGQAKPVAQNGVSRAERRPGNADAEAR